MSEEYIKKLEDENKALNKKVFELEQKITEISKKFEPVDSDTLAKFLQDSMVKDINNAVDSEFLSQVEKQTKHNEYLKKAQNQFENLKRQNTRNEYIEKLYNAMVKAK